MLERVKTSNMGTLYESYLPRHAPDDHAPKAFLTNCAAATGNLNITCGREATKGRALRHLDFCPRALYYTYHRKSEGTFYAAADSQRTSAISPRR